MLLRMWSIHIISILTILVTVWVSPVLSQEESAKRTIGISGSIQGEELDINLPIWAGQRFVIAPAVGVIWAEDAGTDLAFGLASRFYTRVDRIAPYIGARAGVFLTLPENGNTATDWLFGVTVGGEYFLHNRFSIGVEGQGNFTSSDERSTRFANPGGANFNTATAVFVTLYF